MQSLNITYEGMTQNTGSAFTEAPADARRLEDDIVINPEWDAMVEPVKGVADFDFYTPIPAILVNRQDGKLVILDGRKRFLACKATGRSISFRTEYFTKPRAKDVFLKHHKVLAK